MKVTPGKYATGFYCSYLLLSSLFEWTLVCFLYAFNLFPEYWKVSSPFFFRPIPTRLSLPPFHWNCLLWSGHQGLSHCLIQWSFLSFCLTWPISTIWYNWLLAPPRSLWLPTYQYLLVVLCHWMLHFRDFFHWFHLILTTYRTCSSLGIFSPTNISSLCTLSRDVPSLFFFL